MRSSTLALALAWSLAACSTHDDASSGDASSDAPLPEGGCRTSSDCRASGSGVCLLPGQSFLPVCGGPAPPGQCATTADCAQPRDAGADGDAEAGATDLVCQPEGCYAKFCRPRCKGDQDCPRTFVAPSVCDPATGICLRATCTAASCGSDSVCEPTVGCSPKPCTADADCSGMCVNGACVSGPGRCAVPPPPPP